MIDITCSNDAGDLLLDDLGLVLIFQTERLVLDGFVLKLLLNLLGHLFSLLFRSHVCLFFCCYEKGTLFLKFKEFSLTF